ncbi:putative FAD dependent oxidoreductase [Clavispora lusitaniae]|uniref:L-2-hydroxyglutarate dehydrogenase, mitochondrial n=1 Tax=Clavispora lusitaniae TaxID=36911 RepID=A0AA91SZU4_CLALS|nr:putative FAD dependent oxidoreductase [Clavispora lusitaniae]
MLGMIRALRSFSVAPIRSADFSHIVIGGGVVGVAVAAKLQQSGQNVALLEQHPQLGMETTSRNSEVIHAGLYYPPDSLKARLCVRGKELLYSLDPRDVPYSQCGKWVVAQSAPEEEYLARLENAARALDIPVNRLTSNQCKAIHPRIRAKHGALESPSTGIVSAHALTAYLEASFLEQGGLVSLATRVEALEREASLAQYRAHCLDASGERFEITADCVINAAGLHAPTVANMVLPPERHFQAHFAKGSYFSYQPESPSGQVTTRLIYPCPLPNATGLGTHLTLDLGGQIRFGPDLEWLDATDANDLDYTVARTNIEAAQRAISGYFPEIQVGDLHPAYSGVRPKISGREESARGFSDFYIREELPGFINMIGIESPGLTSAMAIGEHVTAMLM